jgi:hypothetical protein
MFKTHVNFGLQRLSTLQIVHNTAGTFINYAQSNSLTLSHATPAEAVVINALQMTDDF